MKRVLILCLLGVLGVLNQANSQSQFIPEFFTNRPLILLNDATSVGWNPAVLGIDTKADLAFLAGYNRRFESNRLFGAFYAQNGFGVGITTHRNEQLPAYSFHLVFMPEVELKSPMKEHGLEHLSDIQNLGIVPFDSMDHSSISRWRIFIFPPASQILIL